MLSDVLFCWLGIGFIAWVVYRFGVRYREDCTGRWQDEASWAEESLLLALLVMLGPVTFFVW
jgi:hypothetical protein